MPVNALRKDLPRGTRPPIDRSSAKRSDPADEAQEERERDLAAQEAEALWESQEIGLTRWSGEDGQRYSDPGA